MVVTSALTQQPTMPKIGEVRKPKPNTCAACNGTGKSSKGALCFPCGGSGKQRKEHQGGLKG